jgi:hypothetical protein
VLDKLLVFNKSQNITLFQGKAQTQDWWDGQHFDKIFLDTIFVAKS